jgi:hypothetical protein
MNAYPFLLLPLLGLAALGPLQQDVALTDPNGAAQSARTPGVDTTVQVYEVKDLIEKLKPSAGTASSVDPARADLELKLERYLKEQDLVRKRAWLGYADTERDVVKKKLAAEHSLMPTRDYADMVQRFMKPAFEPERQQLTVPSEGLIVGTLRPEQHAWLNAFLDLQRHTTGVLEVSVTVYEGPKGAFRDAGLPNASNVFDAPAFTAVRARMSADKRIAEVSSPKLVVLNSQKATVSILNQISYIKDWKVTVVEPGPQEIADPTIDVLNEGFTANVRATALETNLYGLDMTFEVAKLERPMQTRKIRISATNDSEVEIGLPVVTKINFESTLMLSDGASAAFTTASPEKDRDVAIVLTLKHRLLEAEAK